MNKLASKFMIKYTAIASSDLHLYWRTTIEICNSNASEFGEIMVGVEKKLCPNFMVRCISPHHIIFEAFLTEKATNCFMHIVLPINQKST